jgi:NAD(P)H-dependent flavin oxidoreductase YrpB (nitropropane dioxygenase family)
VLLPTIVDALGGHAMVLGSGGISDGRGIAAALALGADLGWVGTRMVATTEASVHDEHKRRIVAAKGEDTVFSSIFGPEWPHFNPMRVQRNRVVAEYNHRLAEVPMERSHLELVGKTVLYGQAMEMRKFNVIPPTPETEADWEERPWLMEQGVARRVSAPTHPPCQAGSPGGFRSGRRDDDGSAGCRVRCGHQSGIVATHP